MRDETKCEEAERMKERGRETEHMNREHTRRRRPELQSTFFLVRCCVWYAIVLLNIHMLIERRHAHTHTFMHMTIVK